MRLTTNRLRILTGVAILLLMSGGVAVYAMHETAATPSTHNTSTTTASTGTARHLGVADHTGNDDHQDDDDVGEEDHENGIPGAVVLQLSPVGVQGAPTNYRTGSGHATIVIRGNALYLHLDVEGANPVTQYSVVLVANGTAHVIASMVTNDGGEGHIFAQLLLHQGTHTIVVQVFDATNFQATTLVMHSNSTQIITPSLTGHNNDDIGDAEDED